MEESSTLRASTSSVRVASGAAVSLAGKGAGKIIQLVTQVVFARMLGMESYGLFAIGLTMVRLLGMITPVGMPSGAVVFGSRYWKSDDSRFLGVLLATHTTAAVSASLVCVALWVWAPWFSTTFFRTKVPVEMIRVFALAIPFLALLGVAADATRISQRTKFGVLAEDVVQPAAALTLFFVLTLFMERLSAAVLATTLSYAVACGVSFGFLRTLYGDVFHDFRRSVWNYRELVAFCAPTALAMLCTSMVAFADRLVVGRHQAPGDVALYEAAAQISVAFTIILGAFGTIFGPMAARYLARNERAELQRAFRASTKWGLYLCLPLYVVVVAAPEALLGLTFGSGYNAGASVLRLLATGQLVNVATGSVGALLIIGGYRLHWLALAAAAAYLNPALATILIGPFGLVGAASANLLAIIVLYGGAVMLVLWKLDLWAYERSHLWLAIAGVLGIVVARTAVVACGDAMPLLLLAVASVVAGGVFAGVFAIAGLDEDDRLVLERVREMIAGRG